MTKRKLGIELDNTLAEYENGWEGPTVIGDPLPGAVEWVRELAQEFDVTILSARVRYSGGETAIRAWLKKWGFPDGLAVEPKPPFFLIVDDRCWRFEGQYPSVQFLARFTPWNKSDE